MKRAVFLDRDGVINHSVIIDGVPKPPASVEQVEIIEGVVDSIQLLKFHEFIPVVVTNQPEVARGTTSRAHIEAINSFIGGATNIEHFYTCFHDDADECDCRKPAPGLIFRAAIDLDLDVANSFLVGDRWRDVSAGQNAGCRTFFIDYSYLERAPLLPFTRVSSLLEAVQIMTGESSGTD